MAAVNTNSAAYKRADYYRMIHRYEGLREQKKKEIEEICKRHKKSIATYSKKIKSWKRAIRRIDERQERLYSINELIKNKYGFSLFKIAYRGIADKKELICKFFCKHMIDSGINGSLVSDFIGWEKLTKASSFRLEVARSFKTDEKTLSEWHKFKKYISANYIPRIIPQKE